MKSPAIQRKEKALPTWYKVTAFSLLGVIILLIAAIYIYLSGWLGYWEAHARCGKTPIAVTTGLYGPQLYYSKATKPLGAFANGMYVCSEAEAQADGAKNF